MIGFPSDRESIRRTRLRGDALGKVEGYISWIGVQPNNEVVLEISTDNLYVPLPEGDYEAELVLESTTPISFLWN